MTFGPTAIRFALPVLLAALVPAIGIAQPAKSSVEFNRDVRPILSNNCFACHGPDEKVRKGEMRLDTREGAIEAVVVPGKPDESELLKRLTTNDASELMPPAKTNKRLTPREIEILKQWIKDGAPYATHWAYTKPIAPPVPTFSRDPKGIAWVRNPIDAFVYQRLANESLPPSIEADRTALIRRVSLDLTGLPPTPEEADAFVKDTAPDAYEKLVDRLLAQPAFGEHWARFWLDLARYADSAGYADDPARTIWKYRDYVIAALNANVPFDRFTIEQIAGDLLPNPTDEQLIATAFHRNTLTNSEGGTSDEEFRNVAIVDRVNTTLTVWMGTSIACSQCHAHKYDPITQKEFFQLFAIFNNTADADRPNEAPVLELWEPGKQEAKKQLEAKIAGYTEILGKTKPGLFNADPFREDRVKVIVLKKELAALKPTTTVPIMRELPANQRRKTRLQFRGNFMDLGDEVSEGVPAAFHPLKAHGPQSVGLSRLDFAHWLVSPDNPLTGRVMANRFWEQIFGVGIVRTSEEFGAQGELPSHPELLDWLAIDFQRDWNVKRLLKLLVSSAAYRQSAKVTPELFERDPENRLFARGPRVRLSAEMVRDQSLFAAGLLSPKMYGPSVKPPQPNLGVSAAFGQSIDWQPSTGEDKYRRGVYTLWRRSNPYPSMAAFDAPNRDVCMVRRTRTNTPLQALVTLNDPVYIEAAQGLARRMAKDGGATPTDKVIFGFRRCLIRSPNAVEIERLVKLYHDAKAGFAQNLPKATQFATNPLGPLPAGLDVADAAAWTVVANVLLNLDEFFMKR